MQSRLLELRIGIRGRWSTTSSKSVPAKYRWSSGHPSQTIFAIWSVVARRAQNAFPPTPLSPSWSHRCPARSSVLPPTSSSWRATTFWCTPTASLAGPQSAPVAAQPHLPGHQPAEGMDVGKRHSSTAHNGWRSPVNLAGIQRVLCQLGNLSHDQQPSPSRSQRSRRGSSQGHQSPSRKDDSEWNVNVDTFRTGLLEFRNTPRAQRIPDTSAYPSCCLGAIFGRKCCHTPAHSSSNRTLWTGQPPRSQLKPRRNTPCAPSPCRFSNQAPSSGCNTCEQSVGTRSQKWGSARLAGAAI